MIDICGRMTGRGVVESAITNASCVLTEDATGITGAETGFDGLRQGFEYRWDYMRDEVFVIPIVDELPNGSHTAQILGFICVKLAARPRGGGNNFILQFEIVPNCLLGLEPGGTGTNVFTRVLVQ
jgi:hypothetical protein